jgi:hypothetical protein
MRHTSGLYTRYKNYALRAPAKTHTRQATCAEVECRAYVNGWTLVKEELTAELLHIATHSGRRYREVDIESGKTLLVFEPGQICFGFKTHRVTMDRPAFFYAGQGRHDVFSIRNARQYDKPEQWMDDMHCDSDKATNRLERG